MKNLLLLLIVLLVSKIFLNKLFIRTDGFVDKSLL